MLNRQHGGLEIHKSLHLSQALPRYGFCEALQACWHVQLLHIMKTNNLAVAA